MKRFLIILIAIACCLLFIGAERREPRRETIDFEGQGLQKMSATAYCMGEVTANGSKVHEGGCAASKDHLGQVAIVYTIEGEFLGYYECNDTGGTEGLNNGYVIDIYRSDLDRCQEFMETIGSGQKVWVKWIEGVG